MKAHHLSFSVCKPLPHSSLSTLPFSERNTKMFEDSATIPSIWTSMNNWFTPTVLFVLLNIMIGTIFFSSSLAHPQQQQQQRDQEEPHQDQNQNQPKLGRSPSVLQRLRSINFYSYRSQEPQPTTTQFKQTLDSHSHYPSEQTHHHQEQQQTQESETHYLFEQTHQEKTLESQSHYLFEQTHQEKTLESQTHYPFEQTHQEKTLDLESDTHYLFQHQDKTLESQTHYLFQQTHQQQNSDSDTHYPFEQTHQEKTLESNAHFLFDHQKIQETERETADQYFDEGINEQDEDELQSLDDVYSHLTDRHVNRTKSDTLPASGEIPARLPAKMRKSASLKSPFGHFEEDEIVETRRPATVRERRARVTEGDHEVDAKADDFINKFKNQLKLQRLDSIIRYKEVINKGSGK